MKNVLVDTGPMVALFNANDNYYLQAIEFIKNNKSELYTTMPCVTETVYVLDFNINAQSDFLNWIAKGGIQIVELYNENILRCSELMKKYSDLPMDFADTCLVFLGEKMNISKVATIDRDFDIYKLKGKKSFTTYIK